MKGGLKPQVADAMCPSPVTEIPVSLPGYLDTMCPLPVTEHRIVTRGGKQPPHHGATLVQDAGEAWLQLCSLSCNP